MASALALATAPLASTADAADIFRLRDALAVAYETNPQLDGERATLRATDEGVAQANAGWRPTISFQGSYGFQRTLEKVGSVTAQNNKPLVGTVVLSQPIFRGGRTTAEIGIAKSQVRAERAELINVEEGVLLNTVTAYMDVVRDARILKYKTQNVDALRTQLEGTQEEFRVGEVTRTDVTQAQARLAGAQADLAVAVEQLRVSRASYEQTVGRPAGVFENHPDVPKLPVSEDATIAASLAENPSLTVAKEQERESSYGVDDAASVMMPQVSLQAQYEFAHDQPNTGENFSVGPSERVSSVTTQLTVPLYQGGAEDAGVRQAEQKDAAAKLNIATAQRTVTDAAKTAWESYAAAQAVIAASQAQLQADTIALDSVRQEQKAGSRTVIDVLNAEQELVNSQVQLVSAERDSFVAAFEILSATGKLTAKNLGLPVKLYDPKEYYDENHARWFGIDDN